MAREPREQLVVDLLSDGTEGIQASNVFDLKPSVIYASQDGPDSPHITVEQPDEGPTGGGTTGFDGMDAGGGSPHQTIVGTVTVHAFADDQDLDANATVTTDRAAVYLTGSAAGDGTVSGGVIEEIYRIVRANAVRPQNPTTGNTPVELLSAGTFSPGPTDEPTQMHYVGQLNYVYWTG